MKKKILISDTLSKSKIDVLKNDNVVKAYVCGITPYDYPHIGHARCYVVYDVLFRLFRFLNIEYKYCRNITDIDDKLINRAKAIYGDGNRFLEVANKYYEIFKTNLKDLGCLPPTYEPRVTESITEIIEFIEVLIKKRHAYVVGGDVYFAIDSIQEYGKLSKLNLKDLRVGARIDIDLNKKDPLDFALWKSCDEVPNWQSPWGLGRPGWHIECSVMAKKYLGDSIDIHGGGMDLIFPHHENEIAQTEALTEKKFVDVWMHIAFVCVNKEKMSKSLGNFFTIDEILKIVNPMVFRYYILNNHYQTPINFSIEDLKATEKAYLKLVDLFDGIDHEVHATLENCDCSSDLINELIMIISDDLNTAKCIGLIHKMHDEIKNSHALKVGIFVFLRDVLGLSLKNYLQDEKPEQYSDEILELIRQRNLARKNKDFKTADEIRKRLDVLGVKINDNKL